MKFKPLIVETVILLAFCIGFSLVANKISPKGIGLKGGQWDPKKGTMHAGGPCAPKNPEMDITALSHLLEKMGDRLVIVDARSREDFEAGHIPGAFSLPVDEVEIEMGKFMESVPPEKMIVTYCSGVECWDSHEVAQILQDAGYENVQVFAGGMPVWLDNGKPVEK